MAATKLGDELETNYGTFTEEFSKIIAFNMATIFAERYDPYNLGPVLNGIWSLHKIFEGKYQSVTERFYQSYRQSETGLFQPVQFSKMQNPSQAVITNFMIHGPQAIKHKEKVLGIDWEDFTNFQKQQSINHVANEMVNKVLEAPRANMMDTIAKDTEVKQWIRKANSGACKFCRMLASRGAVYKRDTVRFSSHSGCSCSISPVFKGYKIPKEDELAAQRWMDENKGRENKKRREANNAEDVRKGLKEKKVEEFTDKYGNKATRTTYVETQKAKDLKKAEEKKMQENLDKLKRDGEDYKEPDMTDRQKKDNKSQADQVMEEMRLPTKLNRNALSPGAIEEIKMRGWENRYTI